MGPSPLGGEGRSRRPCQQHPDPRRRTQLPSDEEEMWAGTHSAPRPDLRAASRPAPYPQPTAPHPPAQASTPGPGDAVPVSQGSPAPSSSPHVTLLTCSPGQAPPRRACSLVPGCVKDSPSAGHLNPTSQGQNPIAHCSSCHCPPLTQLRDTRQTSHCGEDSHLLSLCVRCPLPSA